MVCCEELPGHSRRLASMMSFKYMSSSEVDVHIEAHDIDTVG